MREIDRRLGLLKAIDEVIHDSRDPRNVTHFQLGLRRQRIYGIAMGYEDLIDHETLRTDPAIQTSVDRDEDLGSQSTLFQLEIGLIGR